MQYKNRTFTVGPRDSKKSREGWEQALGHEPFESETIINADGEITQFCKLCGAINPQEGTSCPAKQQA